MSRRSGQVFSERFRSIVVRCAAKVVATLLMVDVAVAGVSCNQLTGAGMDSSLSAFGAAVSASEGNWGSRNWANCVGAFQFCPGTFERYYSGSREQFLNDPQGQVRAWTQYMRDQNSQASRNGFFNAVGRQVCDGSRCATVTASSILFACQFGCGNNGKLANFIRNGMQCVPGKPSSTNDGNGVCVAKYLVRGSGYDVSAVTGRQDAASNRPACSGPAQVPPSQTTNPTGQPSTTQAPPAGGARDPIADIPPEERGGTARMEIGPPSECWLCSIAIAGVSGIGAAATAGFEKLAQPLVPLLVILAMISLIYRIFTAMVTSRSIAQTFMHSVGVIALAFALIQAGSHFVTEYAISMPLELGAGVGAELAAKTSSSLGVSTSEMRCAYDSVRSQNVQAAEAAAQSIADIACRVHMAGITGIRIGGVLFDRKLAFWGLFDILFNASMILLGIFMMYTSFMALVKFGGTILEALVRIAVVAAMSPLIIAAAIFPSTRPSMHEALRMLLFSCLLLMFVGIGATVMAYIIILSMGLGLDLGVSSTPDQIVEAFKSMMNNINDSRSDWTKIVKFALFAVCGFMMAAQVLTASQKIASEVSAYAAGESGEFGGALQAAMGRVQKFGMTVAGLAATVGGSMAGSAATGGAGVLMKFLRGGR